MGLHIQSLKNLPESAERGYYVYLLDYGWHEPLGEALQSNFENMAKIASDNDAVVIVGTNRIHFEDEVFSWHNINGEDAKDKLPAILITNRHPAQFRESFSPQNKGVENDLKMILFPLKKFCKSTTDVATLIDKIFSNIREKKDLNEFKIVKQVSKNGRQALADEIILGPNKAGLGLGYEALMAFLNANGIKRNGIAKTVQPVHFEDYSGTVFERLVFAHALKQKKWTTIEWLGQTGGDSGRDIWGVHESKTFCYQCANYRQLTTKKAKEDIDKLVKAKHIPDNFILVCGGRVTVKTRKAVSDYAKSKGFAHVEIWSGVEFEEKLRLTSPELLKRFVEGESFPETPAEMIKLAKSIAAKDDSDIIQLISECFDRPAFTTPFNMESSIPDFEKAMADTIEVLNTGVHRLRDGTIIRNIPSRHQITDTQMKSALANITSLVVKLRDNFNDLKRKKEIKPCGCGQEDCHVYMLSQKACQIMDSSRQEIFNQWRKVNPDFNLKLY